MKEKPSAMLQSLILYLNMLAFLPANNTVTLQQALDQQTVQATVTTNPSGTHYQNPLIIHLKNLTPVTQKVVIETGRTFEPTDPGTQPVIVVASTTIDLPPGATIDGYIKGMCFSEHKKGPTIEVGYEVGEVATGNLAQIVQYVQSRKISGIVAQNAIWCISDHKKLEAIVDWDEARAKEITEYVADITNTKVPDAADKNDYARNLRVRPPAQSVDGNFECNLQQATEVHIGLFDKNGVIVRELYYNAAEPAGTHSIAYAFDASVYTDDYYFVKYLENNQVVKEEKVEI